MTKREGRGWPDYNAVWRWHFYAGLLCIPFVIFLALTGSIYLFRPQIEGLLDQPYDHLQVAAQRLAPSAIAGLATAAVPGSVLAGYQLPDKPQQAVQVLVSQSGIQTRVYVDPWRGRVLYKIAEESRPMRVLFHLHGELLSGDRGSNIVELAACWAIVMILSGIYLWWPRGRAWTAALWPRPGKLFIRDLHAVTGVWISVFALFLLLTGLPWANNWGHYLSNVRRLTHTDVARPDWTTGSRAEQARNRADEHQTRQWMTSSGMTMGGMTMAGMDMDGATQVMPGMAYTPLDKAVPTVAAEDLPAPVIIAPPKGPTAPWTARTDTANRPQRMDLDLSADGGRVVRRKPFNRRQWIDQVVGWGVAAHEGQLFGALNVTISLITAAGLVTLCVTSVMMWLRRRPSQVLGAPPVRNQAAWSVGLAVIVVALGVYLPLFGLSLILVLVFDQLIRRYAVRAADWLGLAPRAQM